MGPNHFETISAAIGTIAAVLISLALWLRRLKPTFAKDDLATKAAEADVGVIARLERECLRMEQHNNTLSELVAKFQLQVVTLQEENGKLAIENRVLRDENSSLRQEIGELRQEIAELTRAVAEIRKAPCTCATP